MYWFVNLVIAFLSYTYINKFCKAFVACFFNGIRALASKNKTRYVQNSMLEDMTSFRGNGVDIQNML